MTNPTDSTTGEREEIKAFIRRFVRPNMVQAELPNGQKVGRATVGLGLAGVSDAADAILASRMAASSDHSSDAPQMAAAPSEGWVLVPAEPTERMLHFGDKAQYDTSDALLGRDVYRAMLAARPDAAHLLASHAAQAERIASLEANLDGRDKFIVTRGLWFDFVDELPPGKASA